MVVIHHVFDLIAPYISSQKGVVTRIYLNVSS